MKKAHDYNAPGTGLSNRLGWADERAWNDRIIEAAEKRAKKGRLGTHQGRKTKAGE